MIAATGISPLRNANESLMVAATIERCPRQKMLRELVMNAMEAASATSDAPKTVTIDAIAVDGTPKLRIWNTGRGLSQAELLQISDLSSSQFKTAALASNRLGLRYRSCHSGKVSQIVLGARDGVYGRLLQKEKSGKSRELIDVLRVAIAADKDLSHDWTDLILLGNSPEQNTPADPYGGDPIMPRDCLMQTLGHHFVRLPESVEFSVEPSASGAAVRKIFASPLAAPSFDRFEAIETEDVILHYGYRAKDSGRPAPHVPTVGVGMVVYYGEIYALTVDWRWALEAPTYGFTFAARLCNVVVELPHSFGARPEQYRQILRFNGREQYQVQFADFGDLVRRNLLAWPKRIIALPPPAESEYFNEISDEMRHQLAELGIADLLRAPQKPKSQEPKADEPVEAREPRKLSDAPPPKRPKAPSPPEIIAVEDEAEIAEKALGGRAGRYYPAARQVFVSTRYLTFPRLHAQLADECAAFADAEAIKLPAKLTAEWAIILRIARRLLHSTGKLRSGWSADEIKTVHSPETMSLMVDDIDPLLGSARLRMAQQLGLAIEQGNDGARIGADSSASRMAAELAEAEAQLQRCKTGHVARLGKYYRQISTIIMRQRNRAVARAWLERGIVIDPSDPWCRNVYVGLLLENNEIERAIEIADAALALAVDNKSVFRRRGAEIETRRGDLRKAEAMLKVIAADDSQSPGPLADLVALYVSQGQLGAAATTADEALSRSPAPPATLVKRRAEIEMRRGHRQPARGLLEQALALDSRNYWGRFFLAKDYAAERNYEAAVQELNAALKARPQQEAAFLLARSEVELLCGQRALALAAAKWAVNCDSSHVWAQLNLSGVLLAIADIEGAAEAEPAASAKPTRMPDYLSAIYRQHAEIEARRGRRHEALILLERALELRPLEGRTWLELCEQRLALGDLAGADEAAAAACERLCGTESVYALRRRAEIAFNCHDTEVADAFLREAMEVAPKDSWSRLDAAQRLLDRGEAEAAAAKGREAVAVVDIPHTSMLVRAAYFEERRGDLDSARGLLRKATNVGPADPQPWSAMANLLMATGDLSGAREASGTTMSIESRRDKQALVAE